MTDGEPTNASPNPQEQLRMLHGSVTATITGPSSGGRRRHLYNLNGSAPDGSGHRQWEFAAVHSAAENRAFWDLHPQDVPPDSHIRNLPPAMFDPAAAANQPASQRLVPTINHGRVDLGGGVAPAVPVLSFALDAVSRDAHRTVELPIETVKWVVSELSTRISALLTLAPDQRQIAEDALYTVIRQRCSTV